MEFQTPKAAGEMLPGPVSISKILKGLQSIKKGLEVVRELDAAFLDLQKSTNASAKELEAFYHESNDTAKTLGVTTNEIISLTGAWARLGYTLKDAQTMAKNSAILEAISPDLNIQQATDGLARSLKAFGLKADEALDGVISKINIIGSTQPVNNGDIIDLLNQSSSAMAAANNSLEQTIALGTAAAEITGDAAAIGDALQTISMKLRGYGDETKSYSENLDHLSSTIATLTRTASTPDGIQLFTDGSNETVKSTYQLISDINDIWDELTQKSQGQLLNALTGNGQEAAMSAMITNFGTAQQSMASMADSAGNAMAEMDAVYDSLDYKLNRLGETGTGIAQNLFGSDTMKGAVDALNSLGEILDFVTGKIGLLGTAGAALGAALSVKNAGRVKCRPSYEYACHDICFLCKA